MSDCNLKSVRCTDVRCKGKGMCSAPKVTGNLWWLCFCRGLSPHFTLLSNLSQLCKTAPLLYSFVLPKIMKLIFSENKLSLCLVVTSYIYIIILNITWHFCKIASVKKGVVFKRNYYCCFVNTWKDEVLYCPLLSLQDAIRDVHIKGIMYRAIEADIGKY